MDDEIVSYYSRHPTAAECLTDLLHTHGEGILVHAALVRSSVQITEELLNHMLKIMIQYQPALRVSLIKDTGPSEPGRTAKRSFIFQEMEHVGLKLEVVNVKGRRDVWMSQVEKQLEHPLNVEGDTKWKLVYVQFTEDDDVSLECSTTSSATGLGTGVLIFKMHPTLCDDVTVLDLLYHQMVEVLNLLLTDGDVTRFKSPLNMASGVDCGALKSKKSAAKKSKSSAKKSPLDRIPTPSRIPLFYNDIGLDEGTVVLPIKLPYLVGEELLGLSAKRKYPIEQILITTVCNALSTLAHKNGLEHIGDQVTCGWWRDLRAQKPQPQRSALSNHLGYTPVKMKSHPLPIQSDAFWSEVKNLNERLKKLPKPHASLQEAVDHLASMDRHGIDGYNPEHNAAHVALTYIESDDPEDQTTSNNPIQIDEYLCTRSMSDYSVSSLHVCVTNIRHKKMSCVLLYNRKWITRYFALTYMENIRALLEFIAHNQRSHRPIKTLPPILRMQAMGAM